MKTCSKCKIAKPKSEFGPDNRAKDGLQSQCASCHNQSSKTYYQKNSDKINGNPVKIRNTYNWKLKNVYGITREEYDDIWFSQEGLCAICFCDLKTTRACLDHDHITNKVRALLCHKCNAAIGLLGDSVDGISSALKYLEKYQGNQ